VQAEPLRKLPALHVAVPEKLTPWGPRNQLVVATELPSAMQRSACPSNAAVGVEKENTEVDVSVSVGVDAATAQLALTRSVPTEAEENVQMLAHVACNPIWKVLEVGDPQTKAPRVCSCAAVVMPVQPPIANTAVPATNERGVPTARVPSAAVRMPVPVLILVTTTEDGLEGVTVIEPPGVPVVKPHVLVHEDPPQKPIWNVVGVGVPHTTTFEAEASVAAFVTPEHPVITSVAPVVTKVRGAPTARVPTAAVR